MHKRIRKLIFWVALYTAAFASGTVYAAELTANGVYNTEDELLRVKGTAKDGAQRYVNMIIAPYDMEIEMLNPQESNDKQVVYDMLYIEPSESYAKELGLPDSWQGGLYKIHVFYGDAKTEVWFSYGKRNVMTPLLEQMKGASAVEISNILKKNGNKLGLNTEFAEKYASEIGSYLYQHQPKSGYTVDAFLKDSTAAMAAAMVKKKAISLEEALRRYSEYMNISLEEYYALSSKISIETERLFVLNAPKELTVSEFYKQCQMIARVNAAEVALSRQKVLLENKNEIGLDMTGYDALKNSYQKSSVFNYMLDIYSSYAEINEAFIAACEKAKEVSVNNGTGSNSGGGSGGGASGGNFGFSVSGEEITNSTLSQETANIYHRFSDTEGHWAKEVIEALAQRGVISGFPDGSFLPEQDVTRAEFAKMLCAAFSLTEINGDTVFEDVTSVDWFAGCVNSLAHAGVVTGYDGCFCPDEKITRQDAAVMIYRITKPAPKTADLFVFADNVRIDTYAQEAVMAMSRAGIVGGYDGYFYPDNNTTRAEAAALIYRTLSAERQGRQEVEG